LLGYCKYTIMNIKCKCLYGHVFSFLLGEYLDHIVYAYLFKKLPKCFPKKLYYFTFPLTGYESSSCSTSSSTLGEVDLFSGRYLVVVHCGFDMHFLDDL
jgi:hypothetical protein